MNDTKLNDIKKGIEDVIKNTEKVNDLLRAKLTDAVKLTDYTPRGDVWTEALSLALREHETVIIPASDKPYIIDASVTVPSNRQIIADPNAVIRLPLEVKVLMLRNTNTADGTHYPISGIERNDNISIIGGIWEESNVERLGYGKSGMYDENRSFFGVTTCMFFDNINHLTLKDMTFRNCAGFAVQIGDADDVVVENIKFENCFADGIHVEGNTNNIKLSNISGQVGDDLVALNMYDWLNSSVNFGPCKNIICEDLTLSLDSRYKAIRIQPGMYTFDDGTTIDCAIENAIFRRIHNIKTFKLYCQTPAFDIKQSPEKTDVGSGNNIFFEDIDIDLYSPIDELPEYMNSDPVKGSFAGFELGLNTENIYFKNINISLYRDKFPYSYLVCIGPKSVRMGDKEVFNPWFSSKVDNLYFENVCVNGEKVTDLTPYVREIVFDAIYPDFESSGVGKIEKIVCI